MVSPLPYTHPIVWFLTPITMLFYTHPIMWFSPYLSIEQGDYANEQENGEDSIK